MNHDEEIEQMQQRHRHVEEYHEDCGGTRSAEHKDRARLLAIIDEMKRERERAEWRPISEFSLRQKAPKDGTEIEGWCPDIGVRVLEWCDDEEGYWVLAGGDYNDDWKYYPTHYRPLPTGPEVGNEQEVRT